MSESLGLSIGVASLVAARGRSAPVVHRSVLTLFGDRPSEVGLPDDVPHRGHPGVALRGFVDRVGDPAPLLAADGSEHFADELTAEALEAMARDVGYGTPVGISTPAYWSEGQVSALRRALVTRPALAGGGSPPVTISDATAALAALHAKPGFPNSGVVALCDFGAGGTSVTLTDAASNLRQLGPTTRYTDFSGDRIDRLILNALRAGDPATADAESTAPMAPLSRRLDECRQAKENLSAATMTVVQAEMPGFGQDVQLSRDDFEHMISGPLDHFITAVQEILRGTDAVAANLAATAIVGGGACIPLITARLSDRLQVPVFTTQQPAACAAVGAGLLGRHRSAPAPAPMPRAPTAPVADQATELSPAGWAIHAANDAAEESVSDADPSATYRALAWSQETVDPAPVRYVGEAGEYAAAPDDAEPPRPVVAHRKPHWYARPAVLMGLTAAVAVGLVAAVAAAFKLTTGGDSTRLTPSVTAPVQPSAIRQESGQPPATSPQPSLADSTTPPQTPTTTPPTTWSTTPPTTWSTTTLPTTTVPTTSVPTTSVPTTSVPTTSVPTTTVPTTTVPTTGTYPPATTSWPYGSTPRSESPSYTAPPWGY